MVTDVTKARSEARVSKLQTSVHAFGTNGVGIKFRQLEIFHGVVIAGTITRAS
jgi:hypothetical protein